MKDKKLSLDHVRCTKDTKFDVSSCLIVQGKSGIGKIALMNKLCSEFQGKRCFSFKDAKKVPKK